MNVEGVVAVVTGGSSGLGLATQRELRRRGAHVVVIDLSPPPDEPTSPSESVFVCADVRDEAAVQGALDAAARLGEIRVCVNCAGIARPARVARGGEACNLSDFRDVIDVNLIGTFNVLRLAAARMQLLEERDGERGVIVNTASIAAFDGQVGQTSYAASKGAIVAMTLPVARDLARSSIRCVTIAPGVMDTPILGTVPADVRAELEANVPHPSRLGSPDEYASLVLAIVENPYLNGETIRLDGALRMAAK